VPDRGDERLMFTTLISTADLVAHLADPAFVLVDVRHDLTQPEAWGQCAYRDAHLPGARFVHLDRDLSAPKTGRNGRHPLPDASACAELFGRLGIDATKQVVAYDQGSGMYAARLWWMLRALGHDLAAVLDGGFAAWTREGRPVATATPIDTRTTFSARPRASNLDAAAVAASLTTRSLLLVDARARERFRGDVEPLDPVAGHIPGALNRPYAENLDAEGRFKASGTLATEFGALLGGRPPTDVVHYCGSGVSACHNLLAMAHAGLDGTRLYSGSWSEWCADPNRPTARGDA
jgi:thiosulfate/3-mercaptopyruvate sulfurtransferase